MPKVYNLAPAARRAVLDAMTSDLAGRGEVEFAYAHGSFVGEAPFRDIDIAVWASPDADRRLDLDLAVQLTCACRYPVDVRVVNRAPVALLFPRLSWRGAPRQERAAARRSHRETARSYHDMAPLLRQAPRDAFAA